MSIVNINRVVLTGNLTRDPELRPTHSGTSVCSLRVASTAQRKSHDGEGYEDKPNYFNVTVWGARGETAAKYLSKGRPVAIDGRLDWRQWEDDDGTKHNAVDIVADSVQFLGTPDAPSGQHTSAEDNGRSRRPARRAVPQRRPAYA
jgi:single-strand DNA-binding protein